MYVIINLYIGTGTKEKKKGAENMNNKKVIKKYHLKDNVKTFLVIALIYALFVGYLLFLSDRVENLDNKQQTQATEKNK